MSDIGSRSRHLNGWICQRPRAGRPGRRLTLVRLHCNKFTGGTTQDEIQHLNTHRYARSTLSYQTVKGQPSMLLF